MLPLEVPENRPMPPHAQAQTDTLTNMTCTSRGGVDIMFSSIALVSRLRREFVFRTVADNGLDFRGTLLVGRVQHVLAQLCSSRSLHDLYAAKFQEVDELLRAGLQAAAAHSAPGFEVLAVRVSQPRIPELITASYVALEEAKVKVRPDSGDPGRDP